MSPLTPRVHEGDGSRLVAYDHGAHLASWTLDGEPVVWLSEQAVLDGTAAIRGGVPICFPWFGAGPQGDLSPSHGPVRTTRWRPTDTDGDEVWAWELGSERLGGHAAVERFAPFDLRYAVSLRPDASDRQSPTLHLRLAVTNPGEEQLRVEAALHTYLAVDDIAATRVLGLDRVDYLDKVGGGRRTQSGPVTFEGETDRVYDSGGGDGLLVVDGHRTIHVRPEGGTQTVVWNPWSEKAAAMRDLADDAWTGFVCVETAATAHRALTVLPGTTAHLSCSFTVRPHEIP